MILIVPILLMGCTAWALGGSYLRCLHYLTKQSFWAFVSLVVMAVSLSFPISKNGGILFELGAHHATLYINFAYISSIIKFPNSRIKLCIENTLPPLFLLLLIVPGRKIKTSVGPHAFSFILAVHVNSEIMCSFSYPHWLLQGPWFAKEACHENQQKDSASSGSRSCLSLPFCLSIKTSWQIQTHYNQRSWIEFLKK